MHLKLYCSNLLTRKLYFLIAEKAVAPVVHIPKVVQTVQNEPRPAKEIISPGKDHPIVAKPVTNKPLPQTEENPDAVKPSKEKPLRQQDSAIDKSTSAATSVHEGVPIDVPIDVHAVKSEALPLSADKASSMNSQEESVEGGQEAHENKQLPQYLSNSNKDPSAVTSTDVRPDPQTESPSSTMLSDTATTKESTTTMTTITPTLSSHSTTEGSVGVDSIDNQSEQVAHSGHKWEMDREQIQAEFVSTDARLGTTESSITTVSNEDRTSSQPITATPPVDITDQEVGSFQEDQNLQTDVDSEPQNHETVTEDQPATTVDRLQDISGKSRTTVDLSDNQSEQVVHSGHKWEMDREQIQADFVSTDARLGTTESSITTVSNEDRTSVQPTTATTPEDIADEEVGNFEEDQNLQTDVVSVPQNHETATEDQPATTVDRLQDISGKSSTTVDLSELTTLHTSSSAPASTSVSTTSTTSLKSEDTITTKTPHQTTAKARLSLAQRVQLTIKESNEKNTNRRVQQVATIPRQQKDVDLQRLLMMLKIFVSLYVRNNQQSISISDISSKRHY